jgi:hypothetical protein
MRLHGRALTAELIPLRFQQLTGRDAPPCHSIRVHQPEVKGELFRLSKACRKLLLEGDAAPDVTFRLAF